MRRILPLILALAIPIATAPLLRAEESPGGQDLHELRQAIQQQAKQIELLTEQIGKLTRVIEGQKHTDSPAKAAESTPPPTATTSIEPPKPPAEAAPVETPKPEAVPKVEAVSGPKHVVAKGETLTSIAKHYNISIADLKNANKIDNERLLQIGQILSVPTAKTPESSDKKESP
jgi:LysM repeat protein